MCFSWELFLQFPDFFLLTLSENCWSSQPNRQKDHERSVEIGFKSPQHKLRMTFQTPMSIQAVQQFHSSKFGIFKNLMSQTNDKVPVDSKSDELVGILKEITGKVGCNVISYSHIHKQQTLPGFISSYVCIHIYKYMSTYTYINHIVIITSPRLTSSHSILGISETGKMSPLRHHPPRWGGWGPWGWVLKTKWKRLKYTQIIDTYIQIYKYVSIEKHKQKEHTYTWQSNTFVKVTTCCTPSSNLQ